MADRTTETRAARPRWTDRFPSSAFIVVPTALAGEWVAPAPGDALVYRLKSDDNEETYGLSLVPGGMQARHDAYPMAVERAKRFAQ